jgi:polyhydroxybutyrate depolymerase
MFWAIMGCGALGDAEGQLPDLPKERFIEKPAPAQPAPDRAGEGRRRDRDQQRRAPADDEEDGEEIDMPDLHVLGPLPTRDRPCDQPAAAGLYDLKTEFGGKTYTTLVYVPAGSGSHDMIVALHGGRSTPQQILAQTRFTELADHENLVVVAPPAHELADRGARWNTGKFDEVEGSPTDRRDDVAFLDKVTEQVRAQVCGKRVLAAGFSSGGQMVQRWGCESRIPDAMLSAAGTLLVPHSSCRGPKPVLGFIGTLDKGFDEAPVPGTDQPNAQQSLELWAKVNHCSDKAPVETVRGDARCRTWQGCKAPTELCIVDGFPHGWPAPWNRRKPTQINASTEGLAWFRRSG